MILRFYHISSSHLRGGYFLKFDPRLKLPEYYKRNVIWINAENKNSMTEDFFNVAERIKLKTTDETDKQLSVKTICQ